jgi:putative transcriptional regulator
MRPRSGVLLVASPHLTDANFERSVVYLLDHGDSGSLGFIVNRPLDVPLSDLWNEVPGGLATARIAAEGGPVDKHKGLLLHGDANLPGAQLMSDGVVVGGDLVAIAERWGAGADQLGPRLFLGHSGWAAGQLDQEIEDGAWVVRPGRVALLFDPTPSPLLWQHLVEGRTGGMPDPSRN